MNKYQSFQEFLATQSIDVPLLPFVINLLLTAALCTVLALLYRRFGTALSNRGRFSANFILVGMTTMVIISIVKSSLALSLGLVGALSIVRFRAAIKEPEELAYLFLVIAVGLGLGAGQRIVTTIGFVAIALILVLQGLRSGRNALSNLFLTVSSQSREKIPLEALISTLQKSARAVDLRRFDETGESLEASFVVRFESVEKLNEGKNALRALDGDLRISFLDHQGAFSQ